MTNKGYSKANNELLFRSAKTFKHLFNVGQSTIFGGLCCVCDADDNKGSYFARCAIENVALSARRKTVRHMKMR